MTRQERARELLILYPTWGRRGVNAQLKTEFGKGLRWSTIGRIAMELGRPASLRAQLVVAGFSPRERHIINKLISGGAKNYIRDCIADRLKLKLEAQERGLTRAQYWRLVRRHYFDKGWVTPPLNRKGEPNPNAGKPDIHVMMRYFRRQATQPEDYIPKPHHKPYRMLDKATVLAQKAKDRARAKARKTARERLGEIGKVVEYEPGKFRVEYA